MSSEGLSYAAAGVDIEAYERALERVKPLIAATHGKEVAVGVGPFAGLYAERVAGLVYLDAGYELSDPAFLHELGPALGTIAPEAPDLASLQAYRDWTRVSMFG